MAFLPLPVFTTVSRSPERAEVPSGVSTGLVMCYGFGRHRRKGVGWCTGIHPRSGSVSGEARDVLDVTSGLVASEACVTLTKYLCPSVRNRHSGGVPLRQRKSPLRFPVIPEL